MSVADEAPYPPGIVRTSDSARTAESAAALRLAAAGMYVFPVRPGTKYPLVKWATDATRDQQAVAKLWSRWPFASVAVACGPSNLVVIDLDGPAGAQSWSDLTAEHGDVETCSVSTGRDGGGLHLWYRADPETPVRNSASRLGPGIDVRGNGGMVLAPPSRHRSGRRYSWSHRAPLAPLPPWVRALASPPPARRTLPTPRIAAQPADRILISLVQVVLNSTPDLDRNSSLFWAACRVGVHAAAGRLNIETASDALLRAADAIGLPAAEAATAVRSGLHREVRR